MQNLRGIWFSSNISILSYETTTTYHEACDGMNYFIQSYRNSVGRRRRKKRQLELRQVSHVFYRYQFFRETRIKFLYNNERFHAT